MEGPISTSQNEFKVQDKVCKACDSILFSSPKAPLSARDAVSSEGSARVGEGDWLPSPFPGCWQDSVPYEQVD